MGRDVDKTTNMVAIDLHLPSFKTQERVSDRDISGLMDGGAYLSEARFWSNTPPCAGDGGLDMVAGFPPREGEIANYGEIDLWLVHWLPGKPAEGHAPHSPFAKNNHQLGPGASA